MNQVITLPMGLKLPNGDWENEVELSEMDGRDEDILTDTKRANGKGDLIKSPSQRLSEVLSRCTVRVGKHTRPEDKTKKNAPLFFYDMWANAFIADRTWTIVRLRQLSLGNTFEYKENCPYCDKELKIEADLNNVTVKDYKEVAEQQNKFITTLPSGKVVTWRLFTAQDEMKVDEIAKHNKSNTLTSILALKVISINGTPASFSDLEDMSTRDRDALRAATKKYDDCLDMLVTITCDHPDCGKEFTRILDTNDPSFFFPSGI